jgi:hypothetical protein
MTTPPKDDRPRASRRDTLAVWLHLYTKPQGVYVPPVPVRKIVIGVAAALAVLGAVALLVVPAIDRSKDRARRRDTAAEAAAARRHRLRILADQRARVVIAPSPARADRRSIAARRALLDRATRRIAADARARAKTGRLKGPIQRVRCSPLPAGTTVHPERRPDLRFGSYACVAVTDVIAPSRLNTPAAVGYPFRLAVDFGAPRFGWCMVDPPPGEGSVPDPRLFPPPPAACTDPRSLTRR